MTMAIPTSARNEAGTITPCDGRFRFAAIQLMDNADVNYEQ
jgi:hypothetical protein